MPEPARPLLLVADDDPAILQLISLRAKSWNYCVRCVSNKEQLLRECTENKPDVLLLDLFFGLYNGIELMRQLVEMDPDLPVILLTGNGSIDTAVTSIKLGAYDFLTKPIDFNRLEVTVELALEKKQLKQQIKTLEKCLQPGILGDSGCTKKLRELIATVAGTDATVLVLGESGTGKELVARAIHEHSQRRQGAFVPVNMAALPPDLVESLLFGHEKGAFTGADRQHRGCCEAADGGTLFLDEIGDMDINLQAKLLRVLQDRTYQRVGSTENKVANFRVVAATNRNLQDQVAAGRFREDLYYRLNVIPIELAPLRDRREDIPLLANHFLRLAARRHGKPITGFTTAALDLLTQVDWPGNVRQLENIVERMAILSPRSIIDVECIPSEIRQSEPSSAPPFPLAPKWKGEKGEGLANCLRPVRANVVTERMDDLERQALVNALRATSGNVGQAADALGIGRATAYRKIKRYGLVTS